MYGAIKNSTKYNKTLGVAPKCFFCSHFSYSIGDFLQNICGSTHTCPLLFHFSTYAFSEICGYPHSGEADKIQPSIFVKCPNGHTFPHKKQAGEHACPIAYSYLVKAKTIKKIATPIAPTIKRIFICLVASIGT